VQSKRRGNEKKTGEIKELNGKTPLSGENKKYLGEKEDIKRWK
jgi:hypothetical protein